MYANTCISQSTTPLCGPAVPILMPTVTANTTEPTPWWTVDQAAEYLACAHVTVYRAMKSGRLRAKKFGREWRTRQAWIDNGALLDVK